MLKSINSLMFVVTAAKIVVPSFLLTGFFAILTNIKNTYLPIVIACCLVVFVLASLKLQINGFFKKQRSLMMAEKSSPVFFIALITTWFLIPFLIHISWQDNKYFLLFFACACVVFSFCYWYFKMSGTAWNKKGWEDQILKFKGWKDDLKHTSLNLALLIFFLTCCLIFGATYLGGLSNKWSFMCLSALCAFWNLCLFCLWGWKIKKLTNKPDQINVVFCSIILAQAQMFLSSYKMLSGSINSGMSIFFLLNIYLVFLLIIYTNQKFIDISRKTNLPVDENFGKIKFLPANI